MEESATYRWIVRKGAKQELVDVILRQGRRRYGEPVPATVAALQALGDLDRLRAISDRVHDVSSWDELLATP